MLADLNRKIGEEYGVLTDDGIALRGLFLIDKEGVVRHQVVNDLPLGRSVDEALRMVDALQFFEKNGEVCPANWKQGEPDDQARSAEQPRVLREGQPANRRLTQSERSSRSRRPQPRRDRFFDLRLST